ncbi:MAG: hypothetical protein FWD06_07415 [Oscillospiraceae bacterium]|nr:hypothetical protein [Oscillospiraceae bacterium]
MRKNAKRRNIMTKHLGRLAKSMVTISLALVLAVSGLSVTVSATVVDEEFTVTTAQGINVRDTHSPNGTHRGALARNSVVRVDRRVVANGFEWVRISRVITRAGGSTGATNAQMVGRWMAVRNTSNGTLFANRTNVHGIIHSPSVSPTTGTPQTRFYFTAQTTHPVPNDHRVYLSIVGQNWGRWRMNGSNNNRTWTQNLHPFPVGTHTARITIVDANGREFTSANIGTFRVDNNTQQNNTTRPPVQLNVPLIRQDGQVWSNVSFGRNATIGPVGCVVVGFAMIERFRQGQTGQPDRAWMVNWVSRLRFGGNGNAIVWSSVGPNGTRTVSMTGLVGVPSLTQANLQRIYNALRQNRPVLIHSSGNGQHAVVITGWNGSATGNFRLQDFRVNDPQSTRAHTNLQQHVNRFPSNHRIMY